MRRNRSRFPEDFVFRLTDEEFARLRSQSATSKRGGRRYQPFAFTEHGAVMVASVLNTPIAVQVSVEVVRSFVRLRELLTTDHVLTRRLDELERKYDIRFRAVFTAIRKLMAPGPIPSRRRIGFQPPDR